LKVSPAKHRLSEESCKKKGGGVASSAADTTLMKRVVIAATKAMAGRFNRIVCFERLETKKETLSKENEKEENETKELSLVWCRASV
jgi:hypothetical protein